MQKRSRMPRDVNELAHKTLQIAIGEASPDPEPEPQPENRKKNPFAVALGRMGGKKGGKNRWEGVSKKKRTAIARKAAKARWAKEKQRSGPK